MNSNVHVLDRLLTSLAHLTEGLPLELVVAGGAANFALGGRPSRDVDLFAVSSVQQSGWSEAIGADNLTLHDRLVTAGWALQGDRGAYGGYDVYRHPTYPHLDFIAGDALGATTLTEMLDSFDIPQHRAAIGRGGVITDLRGQDWLLSARDRVVTHSWRVTKAQSYGYPLGPTMTRAAQLCEAEAAGRAYTVKYEIYPPEIDFTRRGGSVLCTVGTEELTTELPVLRVCQDGTVLRGPQEAIWDVLNTHWEEGAPLLPF